jgi:rhodanese-related sulfurtransferase
MKQIERKQIKSMIEADPDVILVEVLDEDAYLQGHLPEAVNVPLGPDFDDQIENIVSDRKDRPVIVYCQNSDCPASADAAKRLERMGYVNVYHYSGGKDDWSRAGYPMIIPPR